MTAQRLKSAIELLRGRQCWLIIAGEGTGSVVSLHFGKQIPRKRWTSNVALRPEARQYEGEYIVFIECPWRLESHESVVAAWTDDNSVGGPMLVGLDKIRSQEITDAAVIGPANDLQIDFGNNITLRVFCDQTNTSDTDNYSFFTPEEVYTNKPGFQVMVASR